MASRLRSRARSRTRSRMRSGSSSAAGALVLVAAISTSISGIGRLTYSLGRHDMLPHAFARLSRRTLIAPVAIVSAALLRGRAARRRELRRPGQLPRQPVQLRHPARLHRRAARGDAAAPDEPNLARPFRAPVDVRIRGVAVPLPALVGAPLTFVLWIAALATHDAARIAGPLWLAAGVVYSSRSHPRRVLARVVPAEADLVPEDEGVYEHILVPLKLGPIGEEVLATAVQLGGGAQVDGARAARPARPARAATRRAAARGGGARRGVARRGRRAGRRARLEVDGPRSSAPARSARRSSAQAAKQEPTSSSWARRRAGGASRASSAPRWTTSCARRRARSWSSPILTACWRRLRESR